MNFAWFLAYPFSEGFATRWVNRFGYRKTSAYALFIFIAGLVIYEIAVLLHLHFPSYINLAGNRIFTGFYIFLPGSFFIGTAVTILQVVTGLYLDVVPVGKTTSLSTSFATAATKMTALYWGRHSHVILLYGRLFTRWHWTDWVFTQLKLPEPS